jgi:hypothetical protein
VWYGTICVRQFSNIKTLFDTVPAQFKFFLYTFSGTSEGEGETGEASHNKLEDMIKGITSSKSYFEP